MAEEQLAFNGELDRVYSKTPDELMFTEGGQAMSIQKMGFPDAIVWNIGEEKCGTLKDLGAGEWRRYVCVEAGAVEKVVVESGASWTGEQRFVAASATTAPTAEFGEPSGTDDARLQEIEAAFTAKAGAITVALPLRDVYEVLFSAEEKSLYGIDDFMNDVKDSGADYASNTELSWENAKHFLESQG